MNNIALDETIKTIGRGLYFALLGIVSLILTVVATSPEVAQAVVTIPVINVTLSVGAMIVAGVASLAKIVDRYRHTNPNTKSNGIAPQFLQR